jgi:hypothetical protein
MRHSLATFALVTTLCSVPALHSAQARAQTVPVRTLTGPEAEWSEPFSQISGVRELKSGRIIVADNRDKVIQLVDFKGEAKKIGREGSGPGEYGLPASVFAAPGDTTWIYDLLNSRYLVIDPAGKAVATFTVADAAPASGPQRVGPGGGQIRGGFGLGFAQGIDALGRLYFRAPTIRFGNEGPSVADSTPIIRWDRAKNTSDTVGVLVNPSSAPAAVPSGGGNNVRVTVRLGGAQPFMSADTYVVTAAGDVAVVRARDYHVDWIVKGKTIAGPPIRFDRVKVTDADKKAWSEARKNSTATMVVNDNGNRSVRSMPAGDIDGGTTFPEYKGPFTSSVAAAPNGQIWVQRYMPADTPPTYDVIDNTGKLLSRVVLPKKTRLLGFGAGTVYLARSDEDDLQYIQRYRW